MKTMDYMGFSAKIMRAQRLIGTNVHSLPPGTPIDVLPVDAFEQPLSNWIKGPGNYVVPVDSNWGLWFNFTSNDQMNTSVLLSIKGMNPITGQRTNGFALERYEEKCPVHDEPFKDGRFCEKCNFKWPAQNYLSYPNTLWWDGFRTTDGKVRQFFFTEDLAKSIPEQVIGKEDTIPAFGFAFYKPKQARPQIERSYRGIIPSGSFDQIKYGNAILGQQVEQQHVYYSAQNYSSSQISCFDSLEALNESKTSGGIICSGGSIGIGSPNPTQKLEITRCRSATAEVGVGAGAEIYQDLRVDSLKVTEWEDEPSSIMRLYFVFIEQFEEIKAKGLKDLTGEKEGYLANLQIG